MKRALFAIAAVCAGAAAAHAQTPEVSLDRASYQSVMSAHDQFSGRAEKNVVDAITLMSLFDEDGRISDGELGFLDMVFTGAPQITVKGVAAPGFAPRDLQWNNVWAPSRETSGGNPAALALLRARAGSRLVRQRSAQDLAARYGEVSVAAPVLAALERIAAHHQAMDPVPAERAAPLADAIRASGDVALVDVLLGPAPVVVAVSADGAKRVTAVNAWGDAALDLFRTLAAPSSDGAEFASLWTGRPADIANLAPLHARSPESAERAVAFLVSRLEPVAAESNIGNVYRPMRDFVSGAVVAITRMPADQRPGARQLLHDAVDRVSRAQTPPIPDLFARLALTLMADQP